MWAGFGECGQGESVELLFDVTVAGKMCAGIPETQENLLGELFGFWGRAQAQPEKTINTAMISHENSPEYLPVSIA